MATYYQYKAGGFYCNKSCKLIFLLFHLRYWHNCIIELKEALELEFWRVQMLSYSLRIN
jgi:hypothetical protein